MMRFGTRGTFWGAEVLTGEPFTLSTPGPLRVTLASLGADVKPGERHTLFCQIVDGPVVDESEVPMVPVCTLIGGETECASISLNFEEKTLLHFIVKGKRAIHLAGYLEIPEELQEDSEDEFDESGYPQFAEISDSDEDELEMAADDSEDDEEDEGDEDESEGDEDESEGDEDESESDDPHTLPRDAAVFAGVKRAAKEAAAAQAKRAKLEQEKQEKQKQEKQKQEKQKQEKQKQEQKQKQQKQPQEKQQEKPTAAEAAAVPLALKKMPDGLEYQDVCVGTGKFAQSGKRICVGYFGKLTSGKKFDSSSNFTFRLGVGEVIKGWDKGFAGMREGGKRRLKIPADLGYGRRGAPPQIPANATLLFDVELKKVL